MEEITAEQARNLDKDNSKNRLPTLYARIKVAANNEENLIEVSVVGIATRTSVIKKLKELGYKITEVEGPIIHIEW